jgi:hypothetical protein
MEDVVTKITDRPAKPPGEKRSGHLEIALIVEDFFSGSCPPPARFSANQYE